MMIKPIGHNVLVRMSGLKETTKGGIVLPNASKISDTIGKVLAVGSEVDPMIKVGEHVVIDSSFGTKCSKDEDDLLLINEERIFVVVEDVFNEKGN